MANIIFSKYKTTVLMKYGNEWKKFKLLTEEPVRKKSQQVLLDIHDREPEWRIKVGYLGLRH
jgi:hypothetical protein